MEDNPTPRRFKVLFPDADQFYAAQAFQSPNSEILVRDFNRNFISVGLPSDPQGSPGMERELDRDLRRFKETYGATIAEDYQYCLEGNALVPEIFAPAQLEPANAAAPSLDDVLDLIHAPEAWAASNRGAGIDIAVVDTGIDGSRPEFPANKRKYSWANEQETPWSDDEGHGTMCACIAAGTTAAGGAFNGVAPEANIIACKTDGHDSELTVAFRYLTDLANQGRKIVASCSFGRPDSKPPTLPPHQLFESQLELAIEAGVHVFFSAGNNHDRTGGDADGCSPTSIWLYKCRDDVMSVATCKLDRTMWNYSSRGPGQYYGEPRMSRKPDVIAPTPENGRIVYGNGIQSLRRGWGTSGACPQVAGLAALLLSKNRELSRTELFEIIRSTTTPLAYTEDCVGSGLINCKDAVDAV